MSKTGLKTPSNAVDPSCGSAPVGDWWRFPFKPGFVLSALGVMLVATIWPLVWLGWWPWSVSPVVAHAAGFLLGVGTVAFIGFVLTAVPEWVHDTRDLSRHSAWLWSGWALSCLLCSTSIGLWGFVVVWIYLTVLATHMVWRSRQTQQNGLLFMLWALCLLLIHIAYAPSLLGLKQLAHAYLLVVAWVMFRVGLALGQDALENTPLSHCHFVPNPFYRNVSLVCLSALTLFWSLFDRWPDIVAWCSIASGLAMIARGRDWHERLLWRRSTVRWYYATLWLMGLGLCWQGLALLKGWPSANAGMHLSLIGGLLLMLLQVMSIAGTVHSGLPLRYPPVVHLSMALVVMAAILRSTQLAPLWQWWWPSLCLMLAFALYLPPYWRYFRRYPGVAVTPQPKRRTQGALPEKPV